MRQKFRIISVKLTALLFGFFLCTALFAQTSVSGTITSAKDNSPVSFATVTVKGTNVATNSDADGRFTINVPSGSNTLVITSVGYTDQEVPITGNNLNISLNESVSNLNEIVVTGYTTQRKKDITGSVAVVDVANMQQIPTGSPAQALQGQASGVTVLSSGVPGGSVRVAVRGITSIGNSDPLVLVDGTPGSLSNLNINDIESIQVLKDAGAAAIYGVRGSNGVVIVTTKKGKAGKVKVAYDGYYGVQVPIKNGKNPFNIANTTETANAIYQSYINSGVPFDTKQYGSGSAPVIPDYITPTAGMEGDPNTDPSTYALYSNQITRANKQGTDWFDEIFDAAPMQSHNVSLSKAADKSNFYVSLNYFDQQGTLMETYLKRYSARINTSFDVSDHIRIGENAYIYYRQSPGFNNQNEGNPISMAYRESPIIPVFDIMGNYAGTLSQGLGNAQNPYANQARTANNKSHSYNISGNVFAEVDFLKNFTARTTFGGNTDNYYYNFFSYTAYENAENNNNANAFQEGMGYSNSWTWTNTLTYDNHFGDHGLKVLIGSEANHYYGRGIWGRRGGYFITDPSNLGVDPNLWTLDFGPPSGQTTGNDFGPDQSSLFSLFGRLDYNYREKYLITATLRRDGASVFHPDYRFGYFPSFTAGWRISQESFMKNVEWINDLKLRGGWGKLGSLSNIPAYNQFSLYNQSAANSYYDITGANTSSVLGIYNSQIGLPQTTWEEDIVTNIGLDATLFKNRIDLSVEWYKKAISGLLMRKLADPTQQGPSQPFVNQGNIQNTGIDASVTYHGKSGRDLRFDATLTFTSYNNKVVSLPQGRKYIDFNSAGSTRIGSFTRMQPGQPLGAFFGYEVLGLFQSDEEVSKSATQEGAAPGHLKFRDVNNDGVINTDDRTFFGNPNPDFTAGINLSLTYKNFDFSTFLYASVGNDNINYVKYWIDFPALFDGAISKDAVYNSWTPDRPGATVPRLERTSNFSTNTQFSSYYLEDGSFLKMRSLIIGYTFPSQGLKRAGIESLRVYVQGANLFTLTKYTGLDPELINSDVNNNTNFGIDFGNYPANQKNFNIGVNLTF